MTLLTIFLFFFIVMEIVTKTNFLHQLWTSESIRVYIWLFALWIKILSSNLNASTISMVLEYFVPLFQVEKFTDESTAASKLLDVISESQPAIVKNSKD